MLAGFGAEPSSFTDPLTVAAVAGSMGAEVAGGFDSDVGEDDCSVFSFLLQPARRNRPSRAISPNIAIFLFMMSLPFSNGT